MFTLQTSSKPLFLKGGGGVKSLIRGDCEQQGGELLSQLRPRIRPLEVLCKCKLPNPILFTFILSANTQRIIIHYNVLHGSRPLPRKEEEIRYSTEKGVPTLHHQPPPCYRSFHAFREFNAAFLDDIHVFFFSLLGRATLLYVQYTSTLLRPTK